MSNDKIIPFLTPEESAVEVLWAAMLVAEQALRERVGYQTAKAFTVAFEAWDKAYRALPARERR
jgi:hypothetical protein